MDDGVTINVLDTGHDALFELLLGCYPDVAQDRAGELRGRPEITESVVGAIRLSVGFPRRGDLATRCG